MQACCYDTAQFDTARPEPGPQGSAALACPRSAKDIDESLRCVNHGLNDHARSLNRPAGVFYRPDEGRGPRGLIEPATIPSISEILRSAFGR